MIVQKDDVSTCHLAQDAAGKNLGIRGQRVARPYAPGNVLQSRGLEIWPQKRVAHAYRRAKQARTVAANSAHAFRATLDLGPQARGREKTEQMTMRPSVVGDQVPFRPDAAHDFRILIGALADHKEGRLHPFVAKDVE